MADKKRREYKTDTIKERAIYVYLPSIEMVQKWKELAEKSGLSISKFVVEHVENSLNQEEDSGIYGSRVELIKQIRELKEENVKLRRRSEMLDRVIERLEEENRKYRSLPFLEEKFYGIREYEQNLIKLFKEKKEIRKGDVLELLGIDPMKEPNTVKGINRQLENLERYGLIEDKGKVWKWKA